MINRAKMPRQLRNKGGITNVMPRKKYGIGSDLKDFVRKVIPNELADVAVKAAPFVAPFNPAVAGLMRGIGRFDQRGSLSDAFKQGIATAGFGAGARALGGAPDIFGGGIRGGFTSPLSEGRTTAVKNLFDPKKTSTFDAVAEDELAGDKILTEATEGTGTGVKTPGIGPIEKLRQQIPIINKLDPIVGQQLIVGGATSAASLIYDSFINNYEEHDPKTESYDEYLTRRKEVVGRQMRQYFDNYFKFDKEYSALDDAGKDAFVARYNLAKGGRVEYQSGGITMAKTLQQNLAANQQQAANIQSILNQARKQAGLATIQTPQETMPTSVQTTSTPVQKMSTPAPSITKSILPPVKTQAEAAKNQGMNLPDFLSGADLESVQSGGYVPGALGDRQLDLGPIANMAAPGGMTNENFMKLSIAEQDKIMADDETKRLANEKRFTTDAYGKQVDPSRGREIYMNLLDVVKFDQPNVKLTGNETLAELERLAYPQFFNSDGTPKPFAKGGRVELMGGAMPTGIMKTNKAGVMERDYRDEGGFVPVGIKEKADDVPAMLSKNEFVMTANAVRGAGNGSIEKGAQKMYDTMKRLEKRVV